MFFRVLPTLGYSRVHECNIIIALRFRTLWIAFLHQESGDKLKYTCVENLDLQIKNLYSQNVGLILQNNMMFF